MRSMTGYGTSSVETGGIQASLRIRSVNHRNLDLVLRLPEEIRPLELSIRQRIGDSLRRGRVEVRLDLEDRRGRAVKVEVNPSWIAALEGVQKDLEETSLKLDGLRLGDLLRIPEAIRIAQHDGALDEEVKNTVFGVLEGALEELESTRAKEGESLQAILSAQIELLAEFAREVEARQEEIQRAHADKLRQRVQELAQEGSVVAERLEQEIAILADRSDIREELDRLQSHLEHFTETMDASGPVGKKLDFLAQEISRELTTLGAKCRHAGILALNVDAKLVCEQIREQIQNVE